MSVRREKSRPTAAHLAAADSQIGKQKAAAVRRNFRTPLCGTGEALLFFSFASSFPAFIRSSATGIVIYLFPARAASRFGGGSASLSQLCTAAS